MRILGIGPQILGPLFLAPGLRYAGAGKLAALGDLRYEGNLEVEDCG